jgi:hypothetical protein
MMSLRERIRDDNIKSLIDKKINELRSDYKASEYFVSKLRAICKAGTAIECAEWEDFDSFKYQNILTNQIDDTRFWTGRAKSAYFLGNKERYGKELTSDEQKDILKHLIERIKAQNEGKLLVSKTALDSYRKLTGFQEDSLDNIFDFQGALNHWEKLEGGLRLGADKSKTKEIKMEGVFLLPSKILIKDKCIFIIIILLTSVLCRAILCCFKMLAIRRGEADIVDKNDNFIFDGKTLGKLQAFKYSYLSNSGKITIDDYWLPLIVGLFELSSYPIIMASNNWSFIGLWLGIKTASTWGTWQKSRTAYNRFLLGNLIVLFVSFCLLIPLVQIIN